MFTLVKPEPEPKAVVPVPAPAPKPTPPSGGAVGTDEVAKGVAIGALPWVVAPVAAFAALRPVLQKVRYECKSFQGGVSVEGYKTFFDFFPFYVRKCRCL